MASDLNDLEKVFAELDPGQGRARPKAPSRVLPVTVAAVALIGFGAIVWYAYSQGVRSGSEDAAPLLQPTGDAKVRPAEPGGMDVPHRDKSVYECTLNPERCVDGVERILPPPEDPMRPVIVEAPVQQAAPAGTETAAAPPPPPPSLLNAPPAPPPTLGAAPAAEPAPQAAPTPSVQPAPSAPAQVATQAAPAQPQAAAAPPPPPPPPLPQAAPQSQTAAATPTPPPAAPAAPAQQPRSTVVSGWKVQIGAVRSEADARSEWQRRQGQLPALLGNLSLNVQQVEIQNRGTFYRIQGGPLADKAAADALCEQLKAQKVDCISVRP